MHMIKRWRNRDWCWLMAILLGIIIIILTWRLNDNDSVVNIISMFSSGASIILAVVAIIQSTLYNNSSNELYVKMTEKLSSLENNVEVVKSNILNSANEVIDNAPIKEHIKKDIKLNLENVVKDEYFKNNRVALGYMYERIIYDKLKRIYSNSYNIKSDSRSYFDIILENEFKKIFIEVKVWHSNISKASMVYSISKLNQYIDKLDENFNTKEIISILIIVSDDAHTISSMENLLTRQNMKIIIFSIDELYSNDDNEFKNKIKI